MTHPFGNELFQSADPHIQATKGLIDVLIEELKAMRYDPEAPPDMAGWEERRVKLLERLEGLRRKK